MRTELESIIEDPAGTGLNYLATDAGQDDPDNTAAVSVGSTGAFVSEQASGGVASELLLKCYSHTFEVDKRSSLTCARATGPQ
jgi:hypothetical protein